MASGYGEEIFDVLRHDKKGIIRSVIHTHAAAHKSVIDIGCAIGKWMPLLAPAFKKVYAVDISANNLRLAEERYSHYKNIRYIQADMSSLHKSYQGPKCDFGICINAILTPVAASRKRFFGALKNCIKKGGSLVLTIPSLESWFLTSIVQQAYNIDKSFFPDEKNAKEALRKWNNIRQGNADIDSVPHKHYLIEELQLLMMQAGFQITEIHKLEYDWSTEFHKSPNWLKQPGPWDWMLLARKS